MVLCKTDYKFKDLFYWVVFFKIAPVKQLIVEYQLPKILQQEKFQYAKRRLVVDYFGPYSVFGQYDLMFSFSTKDLIDGDRYLYSLLDYFNRDEDNILIKDFHKFLAFKWDFKYNTCNNLPCIAYSMIKHNYKKTAKTKRILSTYALHRDLVDFVKLKKNNYNLISSEEVGLNFEFLGALAWYECMVFYYGYNIDSLYEVDKYLRKHENVQAVNTTLLLDKNNRWTKNLILGNNKYFFVTQLAKDPIPNDSNLSNLKKSINSNLLFQNSWNHKTITIELTPAVDLDKYIYNLQNFPNVKYTKSFIARKHELTDVEDYKNHRLKTPRCKLPNPDFHLIDEYYKKILNNSISKRKLLALKSQVKMIRDVPTLRNVLPKNLIKSLDFLMRQNFDDSTIQHYISEFTSAISERLAGAQLDTIIGKDIGFLERHGSYQRLLFACESLILNCFNIYCRLRVPALKEKKPVLFIFFNYGARLSPEIPPQTTVLRTFSDTPIVIRLKMLKYKPWLWCTGLRELAKIVYIHETKRAVLELISEDPEVENFGNNFIRHFFLKDSFKRIIAEEMDFFQKVGIEKFRIKSSIREEVELKYQSLKLNQEWISEDFDKNKISEIQDCIREGHIFFKMTDSLFINFINAYQLLSRKEQLSPRSFFFIYIVIILEPSNNFGGH